MEDRGDGVEAALGVAAWQRELVGALAVFGCAGFAVVAELDLDEMGEDVRQRLGGEHITTDAAIETSPPVTTTWAVR